MTEIERLRHSAAHVLATAILKIWPEAQFAAGPPVENGFYYDVELPHRISPEDFEKIEAGDGRLVVVRSEGSKLSREEHVTSWVRIEYEGRPRSLIWLVVAGKKIAVGRFMPEHKRAQLVKELRQALVMI